MTEANFDWNAFAKHVDGLRALGCAVITLTPEDVQTAVGGDENDEPLISLDQAAEWLSGNYDDVEGAILGDYWGDTVSDIYQASLARLAAEGER